MIEPWIIDIRFCTLINAKRTKRSFFFVYVVCGVSLVWFYLATSFTLYTYKIIYIEAKNGIDLLDLLGNIFCFWSPMNLMLFASVLAHNLPFLWNLFCVLALKHLMRWMNLIWLWLCNFKRSENLETFSSPARAFVSNLSSGLWFVGVLIMLLNKEETCLSCSLHCDKCLLATFLLG